MTVDASGSLTPRVEVELAFTSGGQVAELLVAEGEQAQARPTSPAAGYTGSGMAGRTGATFANPGGIGSFRSQGLVCGG